jgi:hypothetical protein
MEPVTAQVIITLLAIKFSTSVCGYLTRRLTQSERDLNVCSRVLIQSISLFCELLVPSVFCRESLLFPHVFRETSILDIGFQPLK